jgi:hypothetical protein
MCCVHTRYFCKRNKTLRWSVVVQPSLAGELRECKYARGYKNTQLSSFRSESRIEPASEVLHSTRKPRLE